MNLFKRFSFLLLSLFVALLTSQAFAAADLLDEITESEQKPAVIHFANRGGISNWKAMGEEAIAIESRNGNIYYAELWNQCYGLRTANSVGFITEPNGDLNRFSAIRVRGEDCRFKSFEQLPTTSIEELIEQREAEQQPED